MWACNVVIVEDDRNYYLLIYWFPPDTFVHALKKKPIYSCEVVVHTFILGSGGRGSWIWGQAWSWGNSSNSQGYTEKSYFEKQKQNSFTWARVSTFVVMGLLMMR